MRAATFNPAVMVDVAPPDTVSTPALSAPVVVEFVVVLFMAVKFWSVDEPVTRRFVVVA